MQITRKLTRLLHFFSYLTCKAAIYKLLLVESKTEGQKSKVLILDGCMKF